MTGGKRYLDSEVLMIEGLARFAHGADPVIVERGDLRDAVSAIGANQGPGTAGNLHGTLKTKHARLNLHGGHYSTLDTEPSGADVGKITLAFSQALGRHEATERGDTRNERTRHEDQPLKEGRSIVGVPRPK